MRIGTGVDGNNEYLYAIIKDFQILSGGWIFQTAGKCDVALGGDSVIHITKGQTATRIFCQHCSSTNNLYSDDCLTTCPIETYQVTNTDYLHCEPCYENCNTCTGSKASQGTACAIGNWDPFGPISCPGKNPCTIHEYQDTNGVCQECMDQCATCKDLSHCTACAAGYSYNQETYQCEVPTCGDGVVVAGEQCDDGNQVNGDGCSINCVIESGFYSPSTGGACYTRCGDNVVASSEQCDDGNNINGDGCSWNCILEAGYFCHPTTASKIGPFADSAYKEVCALCTNALCQTCATATTCATCKTGNYLYGTTCVATCTGVSSYYTDSSSKSCLACPSLCSACTDASTCTSCSGTNALYNNQCLDTCPTGMYNGIVGGSHQCVTCPAHCQTCSSATNCYTCDNGYFLPGSGTMTCQQCDTTCKTCRGPNPTDCVLCPTGLTLQTSTSQCVSLSCTSKQYKNITVGECQDCYSSCATCSGILPTNCLTCVSGKGLAIDSECIDCTPPNGLYLLKTVCHEVCGDGRRVLMATGCDDGNQIDGDGCSSSCQVESGWSCAGGSLTSPDVCVGLIGPEVRIITNIYDPTSFKISFDKKVVNTLQDKELQTQISILLVGIPKENQLYSIIWDSSAQVFIVDFVLKQSILGKTMLDVNFLYPSRILDLFGNPISTPETKVDYPNYYYVDDETRKTADGLYTFSIVIQSINTVTMLPLALTGYLNHYWIFLEYFQIIHDLKFINVQTPYIAGKFFDSFKYMQLSWLPNAPKSSHPNFTPSRTLSQQYYTDLKEDSHFLVNNGYQLTVWAFLLVLWIFLRVIILIGIKRSLLKNLIYFVVVNLEWTFILRAVIETYFDFCLYTFLQLSNMSFDGTMLAFNGAMTIIATVFVVIFPIFCLIKTLKVKNLYQLDKDTKYDTLYREFRKRHTYTLVFLSFILLQKLLFAVILIALQTSAEAQVTLLAILEIVILLVLLVVRPYFDGSMNFRAIIQEFILFAVIALFFGLFEENYDESVRNNIGKVIVALLIIALLMHCAFLLHDAYLAIRNHYVRADNPRRQIFGQTKIAPGPGGDEFHLQPSSVFGSSGGFELARRSGNNFTARDGENRDQTHGDLLGRPSTGLAQNKEHDEEDSLFKDNVPVRLQDLRPSSGIEPQDPKEEESLIEGEH